MKLAYAKSAHILFLILFTGILYLVDANNDLLGDNDFYHGRHSASFADFLDWGLADIASPSAILAKFLLAGHAFAFHPHGPLPPFVIGVFYKLFDVAGIPFNAFVLQLPTAFYAICGVLFFYLALCRAKLSPQITLLAALILACSPIFVVSARGIATYWVIAIVFNQAFAMYALQALDGSRRSKIIASIAITHILLSDMLSILTLLALIVGYGLRDLTWDRSSGFAVRMLRQFQSALSPLNSAIIYVPAAMIFLLLGVAAYVAIKSSLSGSIPLYPQLIFYTFTVHAGELFTGESLHLGIWYTRIVHALGSLSPLMILSAIGVMIAFRQERSTGFIWSFSWIASLGFVLLFYVIANDHPSTLYLDQLYVVAPLIAFAAYQFDRVGRSHTWGRLFGKGVLIVTFISAFLSAITLTWSTPISLASERLLIDQTSATWGDSIGFRLPNVGTRAAGYIARTHILETLKQTPDQTITVTYASSWHPRTFAPFLIYAGLIQKGDWFANTLNIKLNINYLHVLPNASPQGQAVCGDSQFCISKTTSNGNGAEFIPVDEADIPACEAQFCASISIGNRTGTFQRYDLYDAEKLWQVLFIRGGGDVSLPSGRYQIDDLDRRFVTTYNTLWDYYPKRPAFRTQGLTDSILSKF